MSAAELQAQLQQQQQQHSLFGPFMSAHSAANNASSTSSNNSQQLSSGLQQLHAHLLLQNQVGRVFFTKTIPNRTFAPNTNKTQ